jgi:hypothetical protein
LYCLEIFNENFEPDDWIFQFCYFIVLCDENKVNYSFFLEFQRVLTEFSMFSDEIPLKFEFESGISSDFQSSVARVGDVFLLNLGFELQVFPWIIKTFFN